MSEPTICMECEYFDNVSILCLSEDAPITDFVRRRKFANAINKCGKCEFYKEKIGKIPLSQEDYPFTP